MKIKMLKDKKLKGILQTRGSVVEVSEEHAKLWIRAGWAEETKKTPKPVFTEEKEESEE